MFKRALASKLRQLSTQFPVVSVSGPRQSGKTTLTRLVFPDYRYVSLEDPEQREYASRDARGFLGGLKGGVIIDEAQRVPELFSYIQTIVDLEGKAGRFILTGSQQFLMLSKVSQSLAGRIALLRLHPLSLSELRGTTPLNPDRLLHHGSAGPPGTDPENVLFTGMYPAIHAGNLNAREWYGSYLRTYVERDVRDVLRIGDLSAFQNFVRLCAGRTGRLLNLSSLAADCGITHPTARAWISVLEASSLVHLLRPHFRNFSKRIIKTPKLYFLDCGLLCYLLHLRNEEDLAAHPLRGSIFETFILSEIYKVFAHSGEEPPLYFWRDQTGHEIDLLVDYGRTLLPVEIKSGKTVAGDFFNGLRYWMSLKGNAAKDGMLVYGGNESYEREGFHVKAWHACS
ncbi:MAG: AAA family ATPase [Deltaproteobacteria bacterium RBG_19FT_COMBO_60_16]|nr:MAG: AAA family ATPase [Deltaproteobacteria bacterium RBG_16_64_85]OGQ00864.1 MAG: AAA family ATPase [Deltaproteobacteria bacterium RBG_19FT_COMBO_60_16]